MAKRQRTIWVSLSNRNMAFYSFWKKMPLWRGNKGCYESDANDYIEFAYKDSVDAILPHLNLKERGLKKLTIIVEDVE